MNLTQRMRAWGPAILWMGLIFFLSSQSRLPKFPLAVPDRTSEIAGHLLEYAVLALLVYRALRLTGRTRHPAVWAFVIAVLYGITDEWHQSYVPGRNADPMDVLIDGAGALLCLIALEWWHNKRSGAGSAQQPTPDQATRPIGGRDPEAADRA